MRQRAGVSDCRAAGGRVRVVGRDGTAAGLRVSPCDEHTGATGRAAAAAAAVIENDAYRGVIGEGE